MGIEESEPFLGSADASPVRPEIQEALDAKVSRDQASEADSPDKVEVMINGKPVKFPNVSSTKPKSQLPKVIKSGDVMSGKIDLSGGKNG